MTASRVMLEGKFYDGETPVPRSVTFSLGGSEAFLAGEEVSRNYSLEALSVSPRVGGADRFVILPDGGQCQVADHEVLDGLTQEVVSEGPVAWLEERYSVAVACVAAVALMLFLGYVYGLPAAAKSLTSRIPMEKEEMLGRNALDWLDRNEWFKESGLSRDRQESISQRFGALHEGLALSPYTTLEFRGGGFLGPNAFALPGGTIVITDEMVNLAERDEEILAVLAHEIGHVEERHALRQLLQSSGIALLAATVTSDAATVGTSAAGLPAVLAQTKYSRGFEWAADEYAFDILESNGISSAAFADIMERLDRLSDTEEGLPFLSTHPVTAERVGRAREAAGR